MILACNLQISRVYRYLTGCYSESDLGTMSDCAREDDQHIVILTDFDSFMNICKRLDLEDNLFAVSVDHENRVFFIYELEGSVYPLTA